MIWFRIPACSILFLFAASVARAQDPVAICGLAWTDYSTGVQVGPDCSTFSCISLPAVTSAGSRVGVVVTGTYTGLYAVALAGGATQCVRIPGIANGMMVSLPAYVVFTGTLGGVPSRLTSCPMYFSAPHVFTFPPGIPMGSSFVVQAVTLGSRGRAFSRALRVVVQ